MDALIDKSYDDPIRDDYFRPAATFCDRATTDDDVLLYANSAKH